MAQEAKAGVMAADEQALAAYRVGRARLKGFRVQRFEVVAPGHSARVTQHDCIAGHGANATVKATEEMGSIIIRIKDIANGIAPVFDDRTPTTAAQGGNDTRIASLELSRIASRLQVVILSLAV